MNQRNPKLVTKFDQRLRPKWGRIVSENFARAAKPSYDVLQEADDYFVRSASGRDSFYPFGEVVGCSQNPSVLAT